MSWTADITYLVRVILIDTSTERTRESVFMEAKAYVCTQYIPDTEGELSGAFFGNDPHLSLAHDLRKRYEDHPISDVQRFRVDVVEISTRRPEQKTLKLCPTHTVEMYDDDPCHLCEQEAEG